MSAGAALLIALMAVDVGLTLGWLAWGIRVRRSERMVTSYATSVMASHDAIAQLHWWITEELDPEPHPVEAYVTGERAQREARMAVLAATEGNRLRDARLARAVSVPTPGEHA